MAIDVKTLSLARKYTDTVVVGGGAIKGKNCVISDITDITGGHRVTFQWTLDNGTVQTGTMDVMDGVDGTDGTDGEDGFSPVVAISDITGGHRVTITDSLGDHSFDVMDGKGIASVSVNEEEHLIITYTDGTTTDAGEIEVASDVTGVKGAEDQEYKKGNVNLAIADLFKVGSNLTYNSDTNTLSADAQPVTIDSAMSSESENPVQNKVITSALGNKANTSDLATVATSGSYTDLSDKPEIPDAQIQSDWIQSNQSAKDFIKNKPSLGTASTHNVAASGDAGVTEVVLGNDSRLTDARNAADVKAWAKANTKPTYTASEVGAIATTAKGAHNGVAELDSSGKVPSAQLPSYVDDVLEYASTSSFPATGESGKIYVALDTNKTYRWSGSGYVEISESLALGETASTAYAGDKGKANADAITAIKDGQSIDSFADVETALSDKIDKSQTAGLVKNDGTIDTTQYVSDISGKADLVASATVNDLAKLDSNGNLADSGILASDVVTKSNTDGLLKNDGTVDTTNYSEVDADTNAALGAPAGAGKNLLAIPSNKTNTTNHGITYTYTRNAQGEIENVALSGESDGEISYAFLLDTSDNPIVLSEPCVFSIGANIISGMLISINISGITYRIESGNSINIPSGTVTRIGIYVSRAGVSFGTAQDPKVFYPMIRPSGTSADYVPHSDSLQAQVDSLDTAKQPKTLATPLTIGNVSRTTVEAALGALNDVTSDLSFYLENNAVTLSTSAATTVTFSSSKITTSSCIDVGVSEWGLVPDDVTVTSGSCTVTMPQVDSARTVTVRVYVK